MADKLENQSSQESDADNPMSEVTEQEPGQVQEPEQQPSESETEVKPNEVDEPPKDNKAWAAMRAENKKLKTALEQSGVDAQYLETLRSATRRQVPQYDFSQPVLTSEDDMDKFTSTINATHTETQQLRSELHSMRNEIAEREDREAEMAFPHLKSDADFQALVAEKKLAYEMLRRMNPGLPRKSTSDLAAEADRLLGRKIQQVSAVADQKAEQRLAQKQMATVEPQGTTTGGTSSAAVDEVRRRVRSGDRSAEEDMAKSLIADLDF
jgi:hypothetical protein